MLPSNVECHKPAKPKGWSYPVNTLDIVDNLSLQDIGINVKINYNNSPQRKDVSNKNFDVMSVTLYGHLTSKAWPLSPYFVINVNTCKAEHRLQLSHALHNEFPFIKNWMFLNCKLKYITTLAIKYKDNKLVTKTLDKEIPCVELILP